MAVQGASLQPIYSRLNAVEEENPGSAVTFSDWSMQAGDTVTITRDGKEYKSTVHSSTLVWKGKAPTITINSNGEEHHKSVANKSKDKFGRGGSGLRASENAYWDMVTSYKNMTSGLILASSSAALYVENMYTQMSSGLKLTSSSAALYVDNKYTQMSSGLKLTSSSAALYVDNKYTQMSSGLKLTSSSAALYVDNKYTQMSSGLKLTSSSAALYVDNKYTQMSSGLKLTSSSAALYVDNKYTQMSSGLKLTSSSAALYVDNKYTQMSSGLNMSSSSAALYVDNKYTQMTAGLKLTSSSAALYVDNKYTQMTAGLKLTSSSAALYVDNKYTQMSSGLNMSSSSAALYVDNKYTQMTAGLKLTSSSAALYTEGRTSRAYIMTRINADGEGEALIEASKVKITGTTKLNNVMTVTNDAVGFNKPAIFFDDVSINSSGELNVYTINLKGSTDISLDKTAMSKAIKEASVDNGVLTLLQFDGTEINFSKATSLSDGWSGNTYTVTATQSGVWVGSKETSPIVQPVSSQGGIYVDLYVATSKATAPYYDTHGTAKKLYLVKNINATTRSGNVELRSENSTSSGSVYAQMPVSSIGIYDTNSVIVSSQSITGSIDLWAGFKLNNEWIWGDKVTISNAYSSSVSMRQQSGYASATKMVMYYKDNTGSYHAAADGASMAWYYSATSIGNTASYKTFHY